MKKITTKKNKSKFETVHSYLHRPILMSKDGVVWTLESTYNTFQAAKASVRDVEGQKFMGTKVVEIEVLREIKGGK